MKTFIAFAVVALITTITGSPSSSNVRGGSGTGWGWDPTPDTAPSIEVGVVAVAAATGDALAAANLQLEEFVSGDAIVPGNIDSDSLVVTAVGQEENINQAAAVNLTADSSQTLQTTTINQGAIGLEQVNATLSGANQAVANVSGGSTTSGLGWTDQNTGR